jgi:alkylation response protein AidB-like acyl-CoA dehydrogenase
MNLELSDEQIALRDTVRRFLAEKASIAGHVRPMLDDPTGTTEAVWRGLAALGTTGLLVPPEYDGAGMTMIEAGIVLEELGAGLHPGPWLSTAVAATRALTRFGVTNAAAATLFSGIADGSTTATVGPLDGARPTAAEQGDGFVLRGVIDNVSDVAAADVLLVLADEHDSTGLFAVPTSTPGIEVTPQAGIDQTRKHFRVTLDDTPAQHLATASGDAVEALVDDVKVRRQFGQPIGAFQAVQHLCVDMYETVELARSGVIHALWAADAADRDERHLAAMRAKAFAGRLASVADNAIQVFGGIGYTWEHDAHLYFKRLLSWNAFLGGPDRYLVDVGAQFVESVLH